MFVCSSLFCLFKQTAETNVINQSKTSVSKKCFGQRSQRGPSFLSETWYSESPGASRLLQSTSADGMKQKHSLGRRLCMITNMQCQKQRRFRSKSENIYVIFFPLSFILYQIKWVGISHSFKSTWLRWTPSEEGKKYDGIVHLCGCLYKQNFTWKEEMQGLYVKCLLSYVILSSTTDCEMVISISA